MTFTIRRLFWLTALIAIYTAVCSRYGFELVFLSVFFGFGLIVVASWFFGGPKYGDNEKLGWDVLLICFAIPIAILAIIMART